MQLASKDVITNLITRGDEDGLTKLLSAWSHNQIQDRVMEFMEYNQTGIGLEEVSNFHKITDFQKAMALMGIAKTKTADAMSNITRWRKFEGEEHGRSETTDADAGKRCTEPPNRDEHMDDDEGEEGDEATITTEDTMKVVGYLSFVKDHKDYVNS